jgi:hypothetical protein
LETVMIGMARLWFDDAAKTWRCGVRKGSSWVGPAGDGEEAVDRTSRWWHPPELSRAK